MIPFVDTARITPCPIESRFSYDLAKHLKLPMSGRCLEIIYHNFDDLGKQRFVFLPLVRECSVSEVFPNFLLDMSVVDVCGHG